MQISVFNTVGSNEKTIDFDGLTKGELEVALRQNNIPFEGMTMIVGETQVTLDSAQAQIPQSNFELFLFPKEVKSGINDDFDLDDEDDDNDDEYDLPAVREEEGFLSPENQGMIDKLKLVNESINSVINTLSGQKITDPRQLELAQKAREMQANFKR